MEKAEIKKLKALIAKYSIWFCIFALFCVLIYFWKDNKSMFDSADGLWQQYTYFVDCGRIIRCFFKNAFIDHTFEIPMWDRTIGMGSDPFISSVGVTHYILDPLYWISAVTPVSLSEYVFDFVVITKLYLSGLLFLFFSYEHNYKGDNALAGSLVYVFSSTMFIVFLEQNFSFVFFGFPLLLLCADRVWKGKGTASYILSLAYCVIRSFYFVYMMLIFLVAYCIIRFCFEKDRSFRKLIKLISKFTCYTLIGMVMGCGVIIPSLVNLYGLDRLKTSHSINLINLDFLDKFFFYGFSGHSMAGGAIVGLSSVVVIAIICLFALKKEPVLKWCLSLSLVVMIFPVFGSLFNGLNVPTARHIFCLLFCFSYAVTVSFDSFKGFKGKLWYISLISSIFYAIICLLYKNDDSIYSAISLFITIFLIGGINLFENRVEKIRDNLYLAVIFISCVIIGATTIRFLICPGMIKKDSVYTTVFENGGMLFRKSVDKSRYRSDIIYADFANLDMNMSMAAEVSGYDFYHSNQNQLVEYYYSDLAVLGNPMGFSHTGFRGRCYSLIMTACNYIVREDVYNTCIRPPCSYHFEKKAGNYSLYKSDKDVSLVYYYDNTISYETYKKLNPVERETNLMYSMVINKPDIHEATIVEDAVPISFTTIDTNNVILDGNKIIVQNNSGYITLKPEKIEQGQISVYLSGLRCSGNRNLYRTAVSLIDSSQNIISEDYSAQSTTLSEYYSGYDSIVFSFENIQEDVDTIRLTFYSPGEYSLDEILVFSRPFAQMEQTINAFYEHADMETVSYDYSGNRLSITTDNYTDRYLFISIPYSKGWSAVVDGKKVEIINANIAFMAIPLSSGSHTIEMNYRTPYLYSGFIITGIGTLLFVGCIIIDKKKKASTKP